MKETYLEDIDAAVEVLTAGGIILYPTDTVWGIGCDATNAIAVSRIFDLKQRVGNSMIVLLPEAKQIIRYVTQPPPGYLDYLSSLETPTTVVYQGATGLAHNVIATDGSVGIRIVDEPFCKHLLKRFQKPLVSTSANISGEPTPSLFSQITSEIRVGVDYIVKYRQDDEVAAAASKVVSLAQDGTVTYIRR